MGAMQRVPIAKWEWMLALAATALALLLGGAHLGAPSLWHDEAVQVLVAKNIAATGHPVLPSGKPHPVAPVFNAVMAGCMRCFGDSEAVARATSVVANACNVLLVFLVLRTLLGRATALSAAFAMALSPWTVAWAREARFYALHQTCYLLFIGALWMAVSARDRRSAFVAALGAGAAYGVGLGVSLHSLLFLMPVGGFGVAMLLWERRIASRWMALIVLAGLLGAATLGFYALRLPSHDAGVVFTATSAEAHVYEPTQGRAMYYFWWLWDNLGRGFVVLAVAGTLLMIYREGRRGVYAALAFWAPLIVLSIVLVYRRHRFLYFAFPFYTAAFCYAACVSVPWVARARCGSWVRKLVAVCAALFLARTACSGVLLVRDSIHVARGADTTLATRHPQFRTPCRYVRDHLTPDTVVIADTYVVALYYIGRVDNWFPSGRLPSERWEIGTEGLASLEELQAYVAAHPKGFFIAEWYRFGFFPEQEPDRAWVRAHMTRIDEASTGDVTLYAWGMPETPQK